MDLQSTSPFKSLPAFTAQIPLPDFVVITGLNGSGKTHLLQGLGAQKTAGSNPIALYEDGKRLGPVRLANSAQLAPNAAATVSVQQIQREIDALWKEYQEGRQARGAAQGTTRAERIQRIAKRAGKLAEELVEDDFVAHVPTMHDVTDVFAQSFAQLFMRYHVALTNNEFREWQAQKHPESPPEFLPRDEFVKRYGDPPWDLVNQILSRAGFPYAVTAPRAGGYLDVPFKPHVKSADGVDIDFSDLSSGERVLMSLGLAAYNATSDEVEFPRVLLLDEPDAHLHPSMVRQMLDVLRDVFVKQRGVKVVLTTHSPSTVALAPEESLYAMSRSQPRIVKTGKDAALALLTSGVPTLSVLHENRRQVFVESDYDAERYEVLCAKLRQVGALVPHVTLSFISSGIGGSGSCDSVRSVVQKLRAGGNRFVWGIVDWDGVTRAPVEGIVILANGKCHSIENVLLNPLVIGAFLLREKVLGKAQVGIEYRELVTGVSVSLQPLVDHVIERVRACVKCASDEAVESVAFSGSPSVDVPRWYLQMQGHSLESALVQAFPPLVKYGPEDFKLKREIVRTVLDDVPGLVPVEILAVFREIQQA